MKALMVNSVSPANIVDSKMRDEMYMKHLREVEKINNRQAERVANDVRTYRSINDLHHKHKAYAFYWQNKEEEVLIGQINLRMRQKMKEIKSYLPHSVRKPNTQDCSNASRVRDKSPQGQQEGNQATDNSEPRLSGEKGKKQKQHYSLHYRYRKRRQEEIDHQNQKLQKGILSQRSVYLPQIIKNRQSVSVLGRKKVGKEEASESRLSPNDKIITNEFK